MEGIEVLARMENLGLTRTELAALADWKQSRVSEVVTGRRRTPDHVAAKLIEVGALADSVAESLYEAGLAQIDAGAEIALIPSYLDDEALWRDWPDLDGLPACVHRAASLEAVRMLADDGAAAAMIDMTDVPVGPASAPQPGGV